MDKRTASPAVVTTTTQLTKNTSSTTTATASSTLLLKQQMRLNLNSNVTEGMKRNVDNDNDNVMMKSRNVEATVAVAAKALSAAAAAEMAAAETAAAAAGGVAVEVAASSISKKDGLNKIETVTTVPQQLQLQLQQEQEQPYEINKFNNNKATTLATAAGRVRRRTTALSSTSSPSLFDSSATALAKFNRIIDNTVPVTNYYQHTANTGLAHREQPPQNQQRVAPLPALSQTLQQRLALLYPNIVSHNSEINFATARRAATEAAATATESESVRLVRADERTSKEMLSEDGSVATNDDNQLKRSDVHYLLKQLNSFSDIEEIEIVDMEQRQRHRERKQQLSEEHEQQRHVAEGMRYSPTATSLVIYSPSSQSHKGIRRYASLYQQEQLLPSLAPSPASLTSSSPICFHQQQHRHQHHHHHHAHSQQQHDEQLLQQFVDDYIFQSCHYLETNNFVANYRTAMVESSSHEFRPSTTTTTRTSGDDYGDENGAVGEDDDRNEAEEGLNEPSSTYSFELNENEPPSVICKAAPDPEPESAPAQAPLSPPLTHYHMEARLTSSGVQTDITASSLGQSGSSCCDSTSSSEVRRRRRSPLFKCCYTPIDRWREKRTNVVATQKRTNTFPAVTSINVSGAHDIVASTSSPVAAADAYRRKTDHAV